MDLRVHLVGWRRALAAAAVAATLLASASAADAGTLAARNSDGLTHASAARGLAFGTWTVFDVGGTGTFSGVFTFRSSTPVLLRVTDALCRGDLFRAYDNGFALFNTSRVGTDTSCDDTPFLDTGGAAWLDQSYSK